MLIHSKVTFGSWKKNIIRYKFLLSLKHYTSGSRRRSINPTSLETLLQATTLWTPGVLPHTPEVPSAPLHKLPQLPLPDHNWGPDEEPPQRSPWPAPISFVAPCFPEVEGETGPALPIPSLTKLQSLEICFRKRDDIQGDAENHSNITASDDDDASLRNACFDA
jgi:hypothetical protein